MSGHGCCAAAARNRANVFDHQDCPEHRFEGRHLRRQRNQVCGTSDDPGDIWHREFLRIQQVGCNHGGICRGRLHQVRDELLRVLLGAGEKGLLGQRRRKGGGNASGQVRLGNLG